MKSSISEEVDEEARSLPLDESEGTSRAGRSRIVTEGPPGVADAVCEGFAEVGGGWDGEGSEMV